MKTRLIKSQKTTDIYFDEQSPIIHVRIATPISKSGWLPTIKNTQISVS